jgi:glycerol uptake facilitator-like aquaporin
VAAVVGSGIMAERLSGGNTALALLANTLATGAALLALILTFGPVSGAHLNPAVSLAAGLDGVLPWREVLPYCAAQFVGGVLGVPLAHLMFGQHWLSVSSHQRSGAAQLVSEFVAVFGLICVIASCSKMSVRWCATGVASYIAAAYWFTASTSFANPAVTLARALTNSFSGIRPVDVPGFIAVQLAGAMAASRFYRWVSS